MMFIAAVLVLATLTFVACGSRTTPDNRRIEPVYGKDGRLELLKYDSDGDGRVDIWSYMDGTRVVRIEIDTNKDGRIDRWEYYGPDQKLEKVGTSRADDGNVDEWSYPGPDGSVDRVEASTHRDGKVNRWEHYKNDQLVSAEEDTDGDGAVDKWETYEGSRLTMVAFDTLHRGTPNQRLIYGPDGSVRVENDEKSTAAPGRVSKKGAH